MTNPGKRIRNGKAEMQNLLNAETEKIHMFDNAPVSALDAIIDAGMRRQKELWFDYGFDSSRKYKDFLMNADEQIKILCGYIKPGFYEQEDLMDSFKYLIKRNGTIYIAFNKLVGSPDEAREKVERDNPGLWELRQKEQGKLRLFWVDSYPGMHYSIVDHKNVFWEVAVHKPNTQRTVLIRCDDPIFARDFEKDFEEDVLNIKVE